MWPACPAAGMRASCITDPSPLTDAAWLVRVRMVAGRANPPLSADPHDLAEVALPGGLPGMLVV